MPWVDEVRCTGCGICARKCPVDTITMRDEKAVINMNECIRCGICHDVWPEQAVRHDSEKVPEEIEANVEMTKKFMELCAKYLGDAKEKWKCLERMKKYFNKEKIVVERTMEELEKLK